MMDAVNHPSHYTQGPIETIDLIDATVPDPVSYYEGNWLKYLLRWRHKGGVEDLKKARWYLDRCIGRLDETPGRQV